MKSNESKLEQRKRNEAQSISLMIAIYCKGNHRDAMRSENGLCGKPICKECLELDDYCTVRSAGCMSLEHAITCSKCSHDCYSPQMRERVREVMVKSGMRMLLLHPVLSIRHARNKRSSMKE